MTISARRAVINQAIGMVMLRYGVDEESAFSLLTTMSQQSNVKLRIIAERVVADPARLAQLPSRTAQSVRVRITAVRLGNAGRGNPDSGVPFKHAK